jgi:hypothetical protein
MCGNCWQGHICKVPKNNTDILCEEKYAFNGLSLKTHLLLFTKRFLMVLMDTIIDENVGQTIHKAHTEKAFSETSFLYVNILFMCYGAPLKIIQSDPGHLPNPQPFYPDWLMRGYDNHSSLAAMIGCIHNVNKTPYLPYSKTTNNRAIMILPTPGEAKAKAMPGRLYIQTINKIK